MEGGKGGSDVERESYLSTSNYQFCLFFLLLSLSRSLLPSASQKSDRQKLRIKGYSLLTEYHLKMRAGPKGRKGSPAVQALNIRKTSQVAGLGRGRRLVGRDATLAGMLGSPWTLRRIQHRWTESRKSSPSGDVSFAAFPQLPTLQGNRAEEGRISCACTRAKVWMGDTSCAHALTYVGGTTRIAWHI